MASHGFNLNYPDDLWCWVYFMLFGSVQFSHSVCPTLCNPMDCSIPGFPVHHQLSELAQTHVHWVDDAIQPSHPLSSPSPLAFKLSHIRVFSNESVIYIRWPKYWSFSFSISPYMNIQDWLPLELTNFISKELTSVFTIPQFKNNNSLAFSFLYSSTLTSIHDSWKKTYLWVDRPLLAI